MSTIAERTFIVHPDGTGEIYNLQVLTESELPEFFQQFMFTEETLPEDMKDDDWTDAAKRWRFYDSTNLSSDRIDEIIEYHNDHGERELERMDFQSFERMEVTADE